MKRSGLASRRLGGSTTWRLSDVVTARLAMSASSRLRVLFVAVPLAVGSAQLHAQEPLCEFADLGSHRLHYCVYGSGGPTVVMDVGARDNSSAWGSLPAKLGQITRVVVYDRAGHGLSEPGPPPRNIERIANELHALLANAALDGPYVLVGHSNGGMHMRMFASLYPDEVAGLVLLDSPHENFEQRYMDLLAPVQRSQRRAMLEQARETMPEPIRLEDDAAEENRALLRASGPLPTVPFIVLSAGRNTYLPTSRSAKIAELWLNLQAELAQLIPNGRHIVASGLGHYVYRDDPLLVVGLIRQIVVEARGG